MGFLGDLGKKSLWFILGLLLIGVGYVFIVKVLLAPPAAPPNASEPAAAAPPSPLGPNAPTASPATAPTAADPESSPVDGSSQPAIALPDQVVVSVPKQLEEGGITKIYVNNTDNRNPEPALYSPSRVIRSDGLGLISIAKDQFQEVSGYILVPETGTFNFTVLNYYPANDTTELRLKVDGNALPEVGGGRLALDKGWHQISLFSNEDSSLFSPNEVRVEWGQEGQSLKPVQLYREVSSESPDEEPGVESPSPTQSPRQASPER